MALTTVIRVSPGFWGSYFSSRSRRASSAGITRWRSKLHQVEVVAQRATLHDDLHLHGGDVLDTGDLHAGSFDALARRRDFLLLGQPKSRSRLTLCLKSAARAAPPIVKPIHPDPPRPGENLGMPSTASCAAPCFDRLAGQNANRFSIAERIAQGFHSGSGETAPLLPMQSFISSRLIAR